MANLISFDWAIKKLLRNKANFDVLEGFLSELLGYDVYVEEILESESNKNDPEDKSNRVDILVRTHEGELMLVEVQNDPQIDYFQRILYGVSKLATEYIRESESYGTIPKIVSISIIYFQLGQGKDYVYEYQGNFIGKYKKDIMSPNSWQRNKFKIEKVADILPKYYILNVNNFNKVAEDTLEEWIYFLKTSQIPDNCTAKGLKEAHEKLRIDKLSAEERKDYERFMENRWIENSVSETVIGNKLREVALKLFRAGLGNAEIAQITEISIEEVTAMRKEYESTTHH